MPSSSLVPRLAGMMFLQFFIWGAWFVSVGIYVTEGAGWESDVGESVRGWVYTAPAIASILSPLFLGMVADRFFPTQRVLAVLHLIGGVLMLQLPSFVGPEDDAVFRQLVFAYVLCYMPTLGLSSALAFHHLPDRERQFPIVRVFGTIGWIVAGLLVSKALQADAESVQFTVTGVASILLGLFAWTLPHTEPPARGQKVSIADSLGLPAIRLLKSKDFLVFALSSFLVCLPLAAYYAFAQTYTGVVGYSEAAATMTVGQMAEVGFMLVMPWCFRRLGVKWMLAVGMGAWALRYGLFALAAEEQVRTLVLLGIALHGICYDFFFVTGQIYVDRFAPPNIRGQAQGFLVLLTQGLGIGLGTRAMVWLHGEVTEDGVTDWQNFWAAPAVAALVVLVLFVLSFRERPVEPRLRAEVLADLELLLLRHAKSSWDSEHVRDHDRELNQRGLLSAPAVGRYLTERGLVPDLVLCSTAKRATQTAVLALQAAGSDLEPIRLEDLYLAAPAELLGTLQKHGGGHQRILLVAHNPGLEQLVSTFAKAITPFPTAALAHFGLDCEAWSELSLQSLVELRAVVRADKDEDD